MTALGQSVIEGVDERMLNTWVQAGVTGWTIHLPIKLDRDAFYDFCARNPLLRSELEADGTVVAKPPVASGTGSLETEPITELVIWQRSTGLGKVFSSSAGLTLPDGSVRSPDASWASDERLAQVSKGDMAHFARLVPDFVIEVRSGSDSLKKLRDKVADKWIANGVRLAWLIDPQGGKAYIYRADESVEVVTDFDASLSGEDVLPGYTFPLRRMR